MKNIFATHYYDTSKLMPSNQLEGLELANFTRRFFGFLQYFIDYNRPTVHERLAETIVIKVSETGKTN